MKKLLIALLALMCLALPALAEETCAADGVIFSADGRLLLEYPEAKADAHYTVPDGVTAIADGAFFQNEHIVHVTLPDSMTEIGAAAFQFCTHLTQLDLPQRMTALGAGAFAGTGLTTLRIPAGVTDLPAELLMNMPCLTDVYLPGTLTAVAGYGPKEASKFGEVSDDPGVVLHAEEYTSAAAFARASGHAYIIEAWGESTSTRDTAAECLAGLPSDWLEAADWTIAANPDGRPMLTYSADTAFALITDGPRMYLNCFCRDENEWDWFWSSDMPLFGVEEGLVPLNLYLVDDTLTLFLGWGEKAVSITAVYDFNGWGEWYVTESAVYAPDEGGYSPESVTVYETPRLLHSFALTQEEQEPVVIEDGVLVRYPVSRTDAHYTVPDGVEIIAENAFSANPYITRVTLPQSVRIIEDSAFAYCHNLRVVDMPSTLERLGESAFECTYVQECAIPEGLTELPRWAFACADLQGTVVIPEGVTDIDSECFAFNTGITDLYLPASLQTIEGETFQEGAQFWYIWCFNSINEGETHMTIHAPAGTEAERLARWSGESYVIEDAREGTDLPAVTALVQSALDAQLPGAEVCVNPYGFPCVTYSADLVFCFAVREGAGWYDDWLLCCFDRTADGLALRFVNNSLYWQEYPQGWPEQKVPLRLTLADNCLSLGLHLGEKTAVFLTFKGEDFRLTRTGTCIWREDTDGPPPYWQQQFSLPVTDGQPLAEFCLIRSAPSACVVQGAVFTEDTVLLPLREVVEAAGLSPTFQNNSQGIMRFEVGDMTFELNEQAMTLTLYGEEEPFNLILPAPDSDAFCSEIIDGRWMVDMDTVYCTFRTFLGWPVCIEADDNTQTVTVCKEE